MALESIILTIIGVLCLYLAFLLGKIVGRRTTDKRIEKERKDAIKRSRSVLSGQFSEQLAPYFPDFPYKPTEVKFLGKPIDFIVFKGMDDEHIREIAFVEVKSGSSTLSRQERKLRDTIKAGRIRWEQYDAPNSFTK